MCHRAAGGLTVGFSLDLAAGAAGLAGAAAKVTGNLELERHREERLVWVALTAPSACRARKAASAAV